jgi:lipopolysaccharide export system permease protein
MRIIDRYIIREILKVFSVCLSGFILVFLLVEITDKIKYYFAYNPPGWFMLEYFLAKIPGYLFYAMPLSILMGGMLGLLLMARHFELIAMQANGLDALSIARPVLIVGVTASVLMFVANESIIPWSNKTSERIQREIAGKKDTTLVKKDQIWIRTVDSIVHIGSFDQKKLILDRVSMVLWDSGYNFRERIFADKARWWDSHWIFYGVNRTFRASDGGFRVDHLTSMVGPLKKTPSDFQVPERPAKEMNLTQLGDYIRELIAEGQPPTRYLVDWHDKIAFPFVCLIMAALSVPFAIKVNPRGGGVALGFAVSLATGFSYWIVHTMFIALGHSGYIPPLAAAWAANVVFGLTGAIFLLRACT